MSEPGCDLTGAAFLTSPVGFVCLQTIRYCVSPIPVHNLSDLVLPKFYNRTTHSLRVQTSSPGVHFLPRT